MISERALRKVIVLAAFEAGSRKAYAKAIGVHPAVLSAFMSGAREASKGLLEALGYERVEQTPKYRKKSDEQKHQ
jgi:hypothetical protein